MSLKIGTRLGPYEIIAPLGAGGMGEVYRARDTKLKRDVAIKVLPEDVSRDRERLARFEREAEVLAALNHPNIGHIYGLEEDDGVKALVLELVEGATLAGRLDEGAIPPDEALPIAMQIAAALEAAHERGIIHRDLKPANVVVGAAGEVKVLDFGLAKALSVDAGRTGTNPSMSPTVTSAGSVAGVILGTAAYMSPEQAKGRAVDRRADIWSFGCLLFEMLTGRRAFAGETVSETLAAVLKDDVDWSALPAATPRAVLRLIRRCLDRDPNTRLRDIGEARVALAAPHDELPDAGPSVIAPSSWWIAVGVVIAGLAGWAGARLLSSPSPGGGLSLALSILEPRLDAAHSFDLSPDGTSIAVTLEADGVSQVGIRKLDEFEVRPLPHTEGGFNPFYSPDGDALGFLTRRGLHTISLDGSVPQIRFEFDRRVRFDPWDTGSNPTAAWLGDGRIVLSTGHWRSQVARSGLILLTPGGEVEELTHLDPRDGEYQHMSPEAAPDGRGVLFTCRSRRAPDRVELVDLDSHERRVLLNDAAEGHLLDGRYLVHARDFYSKIAVVQLGGNLQVLGPPKILFDDISPYASTSMRVTRDGSLVYRRGSSGGGNQQILEVDRNGAIAPLPIRPGDWMQPRLSPDGTRLLLRELGDSCSLWQFDLRRKVLSRITDPAQDFHDAIWSADGRSVIAGLQGPDISRRLARIPATGRGEPELLLPGAPESDNHPPSRFPSSMSADGRFILFTELGSDTDLDVYVLNTETNIISAVAATPSMELGGAISPDGRWIAYASDDDDREEIYLVDWPGLERRIQVSDAGGSAPFWGHDSGTLFYVQGDRILEVAIEDSEDGPRLERPRAILRHRMSPEGWWLADVFPDGSRFVISSSTTDTTAELRMVTGLATRLDRLFAGGSGKDR